jgi:hypothetical protein
MLEFRPLTDGSLPIEHPLGDRSGKRISPGQCAAGPIRNNGSSAIAAAFRSSMSRTSLRPH